MNRALHMSPAAQVGLVALAPGVHAFIGAAGASNSGIVALDDGLLIFDAQQSAREGALLRQQAEAETRLPVRQLVLSHFHLDHAAGTAAFPDVPLLAHATTRRILRARLGTPVGGRWEIADLDARLELAFGGNFHELVPADAPDFDWFRQRMSGPDDAGMAVRVPTGTLDAAASHSPLAGALRFIDGPPAHCASDVVLHLPEVGVVFLADLMFANRLPWFGDCDLDGWIARLEAVEQLDADTLVPGHGPLSRPADLNAFRALLQDIRGATARALEDGLSEAEAVSRVRLPAYAQLQRYEAWMSLNIRAAYRYLRDK